MHVDHLVVAQRQLQRRELPTVAQRPLQAHCLAERKILQDHPADEHGVGLLEHPEEMQQVMDEAALMGLSRRCAGTAPQMVMTAVDQEDHVEHTVVPSPERQTPAEEVPEYPVTGEQQSQLGD